MDGASMLIDSVRILRTTDGLGPFAMNGLGHFVVLIGENGAGKSRLLKLIERTIIQNKAGKNSADCSVTYLDDKGNILADIAAVLLCNYSHSDLPLQPATGFPSYVIAESKDNLKKLNSDFEQTVREALLYLTYLTKFASEKEIQAFNHYCRIFLGTNLVVDNKQSTLFGKPLAEIKLFPLSPGQKYLLRLCVALSCNMIQEGTILFLDEPESHLHPKAVLELIGQLKVVTKSVSLGQIWIATHSIEIMSGCEYSDIWHVSNENIKRLRSNNSEILCSILGEDKRERLYQFISEPDSFASNIFAYQCLHMADAIGEVSKNDPSTSLVNQNIGFEKDDVVVDYGAGKGRFLESYYSFLQEKQDCEQPEFCISYYAYDKYGYDLLEGEYSDTDSARYCKSIMKKCKLDVNKYFGSEEELRNNLSSIHANKVLLINVLHEIPPMEWEETFANINKMLNENGILIIVERNELTVGEKPFTGGYFVMNAESLFKLFVCSQNDFCTKPHPERPVTAYIIPKPLLSAVTAESAKEAIKAIEDIALNKIKDIKEIDCRKIQTEKQWKHGVSLAFWTHQYANARLFFATRSNPLTKGVSNETKHNK
jgi:predicted ATPase